MNSTIKSVYVITCGKQVPSLSKLIQRWKNKEYCRELSDVAYVIFKDKTRSFANGFAISDAMNEIILPHYKGK